MHIYFLGICGTAMGNAALLMRALGHTVSGSDTGVYPPMSDLLRDAGITILEGWDATRLENLKPDLVVIGNVAARGHPEVEWLLETRSLPYVSLPELLRLHILNRRQNIVVSGTHGKTTTTALTTHLLRAQGADPGYLIGGVPRDLPSGTAPGHDGGTFVIEGDEYDSAFFDKRSKFIQYLPSLLLINNVEFDHADIFRDLPDILRTFSHVARLVPRNGAIIANGDDSNVAQILSAVSWCPVLRVGIGENNDVRIENFSENSSDSTFSLTWNKQPWATVRWNLPGLFNARNAAMAAAAAALALQPKKPHHFSPTALNTFQGVKRRQEKHIDSDRLVVIEDFGHHPTAIAATLVSLRARYPHHRIVAAFEPRSNTAVRKVLQNQFQEALSHADCIFLAPVHRAEKYGADCLDTTAISSALQSQGKTAVAASDHEALLAGLRTEADRTSADHPALVVFFSNGAFGGIIQKFLQGPL